MGRRVAVLVLALDAIVASGMTLAALSGMPPWHPLASASFAFISLAILVLVSKATGGIAGTFFTLVAFAYLGVGTMIAAVIANIPHAYPVEFQLANSLNVLFVVATVVGRLLIAGRMPSSSIRLPLPQAINWRMVGLVAVVALLGGVLFFARAGGVPLLVPSEHGRIEAASDNSYARVALIGLTVPIILWALALARRKQRAVLVGLVAIAFTLFLATGFRADAGWLVISVGLALFIARHRPSIRAGAAVVVILGLVFAAVVIYRSGGTLVRIDTLLINLLGVHVTNETIVLRVFGEHHPHVLGLTYVWNFQTIAPGPQPDMTMWLKEVLGFNFPGGGVTPTLPGEAYINFGYLGVPIIGFAVGAAIAAIDAVRPEGEAHVLLMVLAAKAIAHSVPGGLGNYIVISVWLLGLALVCMLLPLGVRRLAVSGAVRSGGD